MRGLYDRGITVKIFSVYREGIEGKHVTTKSTKTMQKWDNNMFTAVLSDSRILENWLVLLSNHSL